MNALLLGGPCDQKTVALTAAQQKNQSLTCSGANYHDVGGPTDPAIYLHDGDNWAQLKGAPCGGQNLGLTTAQVHHGSYTCRKHLYVLATGDKGIGPDGQLVFWEAKLLEASAAPPNPAHVTKAWTRLMRTLAHKGPSAHNRITKATTRINRIAR